MIAQEKGRIPEMNHTKAVFLINNDARAVRAIYDDGKAPQTFKTLDPMIAVDDLVVVQTDTRHGFTVVRVTEVDVDVDFDDATPMKWIVARVDTSDHDEVIRQEKEAIAAIKSAELRQKRESLRNAMFADHIATLGTLQIANMGSGEGENPADKT